MARRGRRRRRFRRFRSRPSIEGSQFVAVGAGGAIYTSTDGITWQPAVSGTTTDLYAVTFTGTSVLTLQIGYVAVGAAGVNLTSF